MSLFTHRWTRSGQLAIVRDMTELSTIIIGSGPAGYTAAIYLARAGYRPTILAGELTPGGQLVNTTTVENYPGFPDGILGPELMDRMRDQAESFGASIEYLDVTSVDFSSSPKTVTCSDGSQYHADAVIITTGSQYRKLGIPGEAEYSGHGVSYCATCDGFFFKDKPIVVVGGGDSALEGTVPDSFRLFGDRVAPPRPVPRLQDHGRARAEQSQDHRENEYGGDSHSRAEKRRRRADRR